GYQFFQRNPGEFFIIKSESDSLYYVNIKKNQKIISTLPIDPLGAEFGWRSKLIAANDSSLYLTGQYSGFYKMTFHKESGKVEFSPEKYFSAQLCMSILVDKQNQLWIA